MQDYPPPYRNQQSDSKAVTALVLGICSIFFSGCAPVGLILGLIGYRISGAERNAALASGYQHPQEGLLTAGYVCSIIGACISGLICLMWIGVFGLMMIGVIAGP